MIIDADAHVVETTLTWEYLDGADKKYRPQLFQSAENPNAQIGSTTTIRALCTAYERSQPSESPN